jgi:hypothetical protein
MRCLSAYHLVYIGYVHLLVGWRMCETLEGAMRIVCLHRPLRSSRQGDRHYKVGERDRERK